MSVFFFFCIYAPLNREGPNVTRDEGTMISSKHGRRFFGGRGDVALSNEAAGGVGGMAWGGASIYK